MVRRFDGCWFDGFYRFAGFRFARSARFGTVAES